MTFMIWRERTGYTQYIDFLNPNEIPKNTMKGVDVFEDIFTLKGYNHQEGTIN